MSIAELALTPIGDLRVQLALAQTTGWYAQTKEQREDAIEMVTALKLEIARKEAGQ